MENLQERVPFQRNENNNNQNLNNSNSSVNSINSENDNFNNYYNKKFSQIISDFFDSLIYTKNCHKISIIVILLFIFLIFYLLSLINYQNCSIRNLESEDSHFWIIIWMINIIIILISWNFYVFFFITVFKYEYSKGSGNIRTSFPEEFYKSPFGFCLFFYYFDNKFLNNPIDNSLWILLGIEYYILHYNLIQFYKQFDKEISGKSYYYNCEKQNKFLLKIKNVSISLIFIAFLLICFNYYIVKEMNNLHVFFFISKGFFTILNIVELWKTRYDEFNFINEKIENKEINYISNLEIKTYLEVFVLVYIFFQYFALFFYGEGKPLYFTIVIIYFMIVLFSQGITHYNQYKKVDKYYSSLENFLKTIYIKNEDEECIICTEKLVKARQLPCSHFFHLICLSQWIEKGHNTCPVCRSPIKYRSNQYINNIRVNRNNNNRNNNLINNNRNNFNNNNINAPQNNQEIN